MGDTAGGSAEVDQSIADFATYEEFLDSQVSDLDLYYLEVSLYPIFVVGCGVVESASIRGCVVRRFWWMVEHHPFGF